MTAAILAILAALIPFGVWLARRWFAKRDDPKHQNVKRRKQIAREIIRDDERGANRSLDDDLERLRALQGDQRRQGGAPGKGE